jgi:Cu2+-exporting ATPase
MLIQFLALSGGLALGIKNYQYHQKRQLKNASIKSQPLKPKLKPKSSNLYHKGKTGLLAIKKVFMISLSGGEVRHQQMKQMATVDGDKQANASEKKLDRNIHLSLGLMGLSLVGKWFYAPLLPMAGAGALYIFYPVFQKLFQNLKKGRISTELLEIISMISFLVAGYFFLATLITFLSLLNLKLLARTEAHSHRQLINIFSQKRQSVWVIEEGAEVEIPLEAVQMQDIVVVNAGEIIPVDGTITEGLASVDQHSLTGESQPVEKEVGSKVFATTLVLAGRILIQVEDTGSNTNAAKIGHILEQTQEYKESLRLRGKRIADGFIAPTLIVSGLTLPLLGPNAAMAILWSGFGYNMKLFGPISVLNFLHIMAKNGLLIKDGRSLEMLQQIDTVVFDKTGTLTMEQPQLSQIHPLQPYNEETLLTYAAAAEYRQTHPIAKAILTAAEQRGLDLPVIDDAAYQVGYGIEVKIETTVLYVGSARFMQQKGIHLAAEIQNLKTQCDARGHSLIYVAVNDHLAGMLELQPCIRPEAKEVINYLKAQNISLYIISGDHEQPTRRLAKELGIEQYFAETLPDKKAELIAGLRANGKFVGYIGDGINDAIALKQANVSISLRGASTAATDTAQIILMDGDLNKLKSLFEISKSFEENMHTNYLTSMIPGVICLGGVFLFHMGLVGSLVVYFTSKMVGITNSMLPLVKYENNDNLPKKS